MFPTSNLSIPPSSSMESVQPVHFVINYLQTQIKNRQELLVPLQLNLNHLERLAREEARRKQQMENMPSMNFSARQYSPQMSPSEFNHPPPPNLSVLQPNNSNQGNLSQTLSGQPSMSPLMSAPSPPVSNHIDRYNHIKLQIQNIQYEIDILQTAMLVLHNQATSKSFV